MRLRKFPSGTLTSAGRYFAYGADMSTGLLESRVGQVSIIGRARLDHYRHGFSPDSDGAGSGVLIPAAAEVVFGVLYQLTPDQLLTLDELNGPDTRIRLAVSRCNEAGGPIHRSDRAINADTYGAISATVGRFPREVYLSHCAAGAAEHDLPEVELAQLPTIVIHPR